MNNIHTARGIYGRSNSDIRLVAAALVAAGAAYASEEALPSGSLLNRRKGVPLLERLLAIWRGEADHQRMVATSLVGMVQTRANRFYVAVAALTWDHDDDLAAAVRDSQAGLHGRVR